MAEWLDWVKVNMNQFLISKVPPSWVNIEFTRKLQGIALEAWTDGLQETRDPEEIKQTFNPDNPGIVTEALSQYRSTALHGRLVVAQAITGGPYLGFAMARNDVSPKEADPLSFITRSTKRVTAVAHNRFDVPGESHVYAWERHVAVRPNAPRGIGTKLVQASLEPTSFWTYPPSSSNFHPRQKATAYIDAENTRSQRFFGSLGFEWDGSSKTVPRFGSENPVDQRRYVAPSIELVLGNCASRLANIENS